MYNYITYTDQSQALSKAAERYLQYAIGNPFTAVFSDSSRARACVYVCVYVFIILYIYYWVQLLHFLRKACRKRASTAHISTSFTPIYRSKKPPTDFRGRLC
jgi:hypothetical protein